ncbi:MFS transporter [Singulisphaera sp. PoT]|uniref:MFS transporter n=1 Tax=Singulisphaera sp. PoT TaxID=3411797 RepID=UPI003BF563F6
MNQESGKATRIQVFSFNTPSMRAFHMAWASFFLCFFAWFGIAPLMKVVRDEMGLSKEQLGWCMIGSVASTIVARVVMGRVCDRIGPRRAFSMLLILGSLPVMGIGLAHDFATFLLFRIMIGMIGAAFVVTQYHTSMMFASNCIGTANATTAGWGNMGGGITQMAMPALYALLAGTLGFGSYWGWRLAMACVGLVCLLAGVAYFFLTQDTPEGNFADLEDAGRKRERKRSGGIFEAARDRRVWVLFVLYGACFGVELTIDNVAALYYSDHFGLSLTGAGLAAGSFGLMHLFARTLGGFASDRFGMRWGLSGRITLLFMTLMAEGVGLILFSRMTSVAAAIPAMLAFGLFMKMAEGATYAVVPFVNRRAFGAVAGIVGAGGNAGAVAAGFLFNGTLDWPTALMVLGVVVTLSSFLTLSIRFSTVNDAERDVAVERHRERPEFAVATT